MISIKKSLTVVLLLCVAATIHAQDKSSSFSKKGDKHYAQLQYSNAVNYYKQGYGIASGVAKDQLASKVADCYWLLRNHDSAYVWYGKLSSADATAQYRKAELDAMFGNYAQASSALSSMSAFGQRSAGFNKTNRMKADSADWVLTYADNINTDYFKEFSPAATQNGLVWATNQPKKFSKNGIMGWDNMGYARLLSVSDNSKITATPIPSGRNLNDPNAQDAKRPTRLAQHNSLSDVELLGNVRIPKNLISKLKAIQGMTTPIEFSDKFKYNIAHTSFDNTNSLIYFSGNRQEKLKNATRTVGIASAKKADAILSEVKFLFADGKDHSLMHPAVHTNGTTLVFASNKADGKGGFDLYVSEKQSDGSWSAPQAINALNSSGNELFPAFSQDGVLYFSSDGWAGLGGLDIYKAQLKGNIASDVQHLSYPVNSSFDDFGITFSAANNGFLTSDRLGSDDIYKFNYDMKIVKINGTVKSEETGAGKPGVKVVLYEKNDKGEWEEVATQLTDANGNYSFNGRPNREYRVKAFDPSGDQTIDFNTNNTFSSKSLNEIVLKDKKPVVIVAVPDTFRYIIYFDFDKSVITKESEEILAQVTTKLAESVQYKCSLAGHTDQEGTAKYNMKLSQRRAEAAKKYIRTYTGIADRVNTAYYGYTRPVVVTKNRKEAKKNRRVEIEIMK